MAEEDTTNTETNTATTTAPPETVPEVAAEAAPAGAAVPTIPQPEKHWFWGLGRRKRSVARVRL